MRWRCRLVTAARLNQQAARRKGMAIGIALERVLSAAWSPASAARSCGAVLWRAAEEPLPVALQRDAGMIGNATAGRFADPPQTRKGWRSHARRRQCRRARIGFERCRHRDGIAAERQHAALSALTIPGPADETRALIRARIEAERHRLAEVEVAVGQWRQAGPATLNPGGIAGDMAVTDDGNVRRIDRPRDEWDDHRCASQRGAGPEHDDGDR